MENLEFVEVEDDEAVGLHSSEQVVTLVAYSARCLLAPNFWGLRVLLVGREAAQLSLWLLLAVLGGTRGLCSFSK